MNIGQAAKASGVSTKMIRYYDEIALVRASSRSDANYREFDDREINELRFVKRARSLGFTLAEIAQLLSLWRDEDRPSRDVKAIAKRRLAEIEAKIAEMQGMAHILRDLALRCTGDDRPNCPILAELNAARPV